MKYKAMHSLKRLRRKMLMFRVTSSLIFVVSEVRRDVMLPVLFLSKKPISCCVRIGHEKKKNAEKKKWNYRSVSMTHK